VCEDGFVQLRPETQEALEKLRPIIEMLGYRVELGEECECDIPRCIIRLDSLAAPAEAAHEVGHAILGWGCCPEHMEFEAHGAAKVLCLLLDLPFSGGEDLTYWLNHIRNKKVVCWREDGGYDTWTPESCRLGNPVRWKFVSEGDEEVDCESEKGGV